MHFLIRELLADYQNNVVKMVTEHVLKEVNSLANDEALCGSGFQQLTKVLVDVGKGLSFTKREHISIEEFGCLLFNMGPLNQPAALSPALWRTSTFLDTLCITVQMFVCSVKENVPQNHTMSNIFTAYVKVACGTHKVNFGPWSARGFPGSRNVRKKG
jgi:hypothetical protein